MSGLPADTPSRSPKLAVDRTLPIPVGVQLRGQIEYGIAIGEFASGEKLPSVRELARSLEVAPVTVSNVYKELQERSLIETLPGKGTFVRERNGGERSGRSPIALHHAVDDLFGRAAALGFAPSEVSEVFNAKLGRLTQPVRPLELAFLGLFENATRAYAASLRWHLRPKDTLTPATFAGLERDNALLERIKRSDLVMTFGHREREAQELLGEGVRVTPLRFIPATATRTGLAALDPRARVAGVATFPEFVLTMRAGLRRFSPHVAEVRVLPLTDPELPNLLAWATFVVYATGAERVLETLPPRIEATEYRHTPEPAHVETALLPLLAELRQQREPKEPA